MLGQSPRSRGSSQAACVEGIRWGSFDCIHKLLPVPFCTKHHLPCDGAARCCILQSDCLESNGMRVGTLTNLSAFTLIPLIGAECFQPARIRISLQGLKEWQIMDLVYTRAAREQAPSIILGSQPFKLAGRAGGFALQFWPSGAPTDGH